MKTPLTFLLSLTFLFLYPSISFSQPLESQKYISGAFGFKLGEVLNESDILEVYTDKIRLGGFRVKPKKPNPIFSLYEVKIDLESKEIYSIEATEDWYGNEKSYDEKSCNEDKEYLKELLSNKYRGESSENLIGISKRETPVFDLRQGLRWIRVGCEVYKGGWDKIFIMYRDDDLHRKVLKRAQHQKFLKKKLELGEDGL